jgi:hypothetical protein
VEIAWELVRLIWTHWGTWQTPADRGRHGLELSAPALPPRCRGQDDDPVQLAVAFLEASVGAPGQDLGSDPAAPRLANPIDAGRAPPASPVLPRFP